MRATKYDLQKLYFLFDDTLQNKRQFDEKNLHKYTKSTGEVVRM